MPSVFLYGYYGYPVGYGLGIDPTYLLLIIPALLLSLYAQFRVKSTFNRFSQVGSRSGLTGEGAARQILDRSGLFNVRIERVPGSLTDHFDPRTNVLRLSDATYANASIAAIGVAAHEAGHAIQFQEGYLPNRIRGSLVPVANIGSRFGPYLALFGLILGMTSLLNIGIVLFFFAFLFYLVTLPVEFNASRRAVRILADQSILTNTELDGAQSVLRAAALTYVASALMAFANLVRLILLSRNSRDRR